MPPHSTHRCAQLPRHARTARPIGAGGLIGSAIVANAPPDGYTFGITSIATVVILRCVYIYNDFVLPFLYAARPSENTVSMMLFTFASINSTVSQAVIMAAVVLVIAPTLVAFFFLQRFIYAGITNGSVKG